MSLASKSQSKTEKLPDNGSTDTAGKRPADEVRPVHDIESLLLDSLETRWSTFAEQVSKSRLHPTEKGIHDLRVAIRRVIALLEMIKPLTARNKRMMVFKELKGHLKSLSSLRDIQVQILLARKLTKDFPIMSSFLAALAASEKIALKQARREISRIDVNTLTEHLQKTKETLVRFLSDKAILDMAQSITRGELSKLFAQAVILRTEILQAKSGNDELIHKLRIVFKHFRYMVEALRPMLPHVTDATMKAMNRFQLRMGDIQDTDVLIEGVDGYAAKIRKIERPLFTPVRSFLGNHKNDRINEFVASIDELYHFWECVR